MTPQRRNRCRLTAVMILVAAGHFMTGPLARLEHAAHGDEAHKAEGARATPANSDSAKLGVTRADLASAYLRFEQAYALAPPVGEKMAQINKSFDLATLAFFSGKNAEAIRTIDELTHSLAAMRTTRTEAAIDSLKAVVEPPVSSSNRALHATCRIASIYAWPSQEPVELKLRLRLVDPKGQAVLDSPVAVTVGPGIQVDTRVPLAVAGDRVIPGLYHITLGSADGRAVPIGRMNLVEGAELDEQRAANEKRLAAIVPSSDAITQAIGSCRARNRLLDDRPSDVNSAQFLVDLNALAGEVSKEIQALSSGKAPYFRRRGDYWRVFPVGTREIPLRVHASQAACTDTPAPLLVVFHGMGGDENMFLEAYGAGIIRQIGDKKGLLIASPLTYSFGSDINTLNALIETLSHDYAIDRDRVYVLGHSLGAGTTAGLARGHGDVIAAACGIAGGSYQAKPNTPPILVVSPELDGVVSPKSLQAATEKAASDGAPIELRIMPGYGHTLAVGAILPDAVDWLLGHKRLAGTPK